MKIEQTHLTDVLVITPSYFEDSRGFFSETWNRQVLSDEGIEVDFVQDNHSLSVETGTLRGLHYQAPPHAQDKLVRCIAGTIWDVAVDVRTESLTFGQHVGVEISAQNRKQILVPKGFLHGFITLEDDVEVMYKCSDYYSPKADGSVLWSSATLGIEWPVNGPPVLSAKDAAALDFSDWQSPFTRDKK